MKKDNFFKIKNFLILKKKYLIISAVALSIITPVSVFIVYKYGLNNTNIKTPMIKDDNSLLDERIFPNLKNQSFDNDVLVLNNEKVINNDLLAKIIKQIIKQFGTSKGNIYFSTKIINPLEAYINITWNHKNRKVEKIYKIVLE